MITGNIINGNISTKGNTTIQAFDPSTQSDLPEKFVVATTEEIDEAVAVAKAALPIYAAKSKEQKANFLRTIANEIEALGDTLVQRVMSESGLAQGRVLGERGRTCGQLRMFADIVEEGSWLNAIIDEAIPDRQPLPRVDIRKMLMPIGPVVVFGASNFPLAYSTAGGDTASALAAGCPVIIKGHPSHPGTNALVASAINKAVTQCDMPSGVFASLNGGIDLGQQLAQHPDVQAIGFTGSVGGGRALMDTAARRPNPIPVYAEMGSTNPIFVLPTATEGDISSLAQSLVGSVTLGAGQFCTKPGLLVMIDNDQSKTLRQEMVEAFKKAPSHLMLSEGIFQKYEANKKDKFEHVAVNGQYQATPDNSLHVVPGFAEVNASDFLNDKNLHHEVFGAFTLAILCKDMNEMVSVCNGIEGQLTGSIFGSASEFVKNSDLVASLQNRVGRLIFNGVPTGVEVCHAMNHGGPYPSSSNVLYTAVGKDAIYRFARPISFQNSPQELLPAALQDGNPLGIWRQVNGERIK